MSDGAVRLGAFRLETPIAAGGSSEIWRAVHEAQGVAVAAKLLTREWSRRPAAVAAFRRELQLVCGLDHPNIVLILDHGEVAPAIETRAGSRLPAGSPYLIMELQSRGSLAPACGRLPWPDAREVLLRLLDALAHAHARGMMHGDVKPANVLLAGPDDLRPGIKLADFGIARALSDALTEDGIAGTPAFMAPEQFEGGGRDLGPWTDLYALGCLAHALVAGQPPFPYAELWRAKAAHLQEDVPALRPAVPVPAGLESWLFRLLAKSPAERFQRAADAAHTLRALGEPDMSAATFALPDATIPPATEPFDPRLLPTASPAPLSARRRALPPISLPPVPPTWRTSPGEPSPPALAGVGIGLYGLRSIPLVDREPERDRMWSELQLVIREQRARLLLLRGAAGQGKSRLAEWIAERADEVGAAAVLRAVHRPVPDRRTGLSGMLAEHLHTDGLHPPDVLERVRRQLSRLGAGGDAYEMRVLAEMLAPRSDSGQSDSLRMVTDRPGPASPGDRQRVLRRYLERLSRQRPVLLLLDDLQWDAETIQFARELIAAQARSPFPALLVGTVLEEALAERPEESAAIDEVLSLEGCSAIEVRPLAGRARTALVRELLGLRGELAAQVEERSAGNPLFAVQLVGDWVQRGILIAGADGFDLEPGAQAALPDDLRQVWSARVARLLEGRPQGDRISLQLAATLGHHVEPDEWTAAGAVLGVLARPELVDRMVTQRLARRSPNGWSFVHAMLKESLEQDARQEGRAAALHRACADVLAARPRRPGDAERLGRHLLAAGAPEEALSELLAAARELRRAGDLNRAAVLLDEHETALGSTVLAEPDRRALDAALLRSLVLAQKGDPARAREWAERAREPAARAGWVELEAEATGAAASAAAKCGDLASARALHERARALYGGLGDAHGVCRSLVKLGRTIADLGDPAGAEARLAEARAIGAELGGWEAEAECLRGLGKLALGRGDLGRARDLYQLAHDIDLARDDRPAQVIDVMLLSVIAGMRGELEAAEQGYRRVLAIAEDHGQPAIAIDATTSLGLLALERGRFAEARRILDQARLAVERKGDAVGVAVVRAALLPAAAAARDLAAWDESLDELRRRLEQAPLAEFSIAWAAERGGDLIGEAGDVARARQAYRIALEQWRALGDPERAAAVAAALQRLD